MIAAGDSHLNLRRERSEEAARAADVSATGA
jgi:hypothetical protein